ncbi:hypothetical protein HYDPIDRAFT_25206 [Hydnomerulius pinastri MD-312]|nr:hypothetical protein HYDPIDRAFT_25206 [Hydnomerulius pinastri MD-312]
MQTTTFLNQSNHLDPETTLYTVFFCINTAVFNGRHGDACGMLKGFWAPFGFEGAPRLIIVLAKHRSDANHWVVHRFSLPDGALATYDSYPERTLPDGRYGSLRPNMRHNSIKAKYQLSGRAKRMLYKTPLLVFLFRGLFDGVLFTVCLLDRTLGAAEVVCLPAFETM